MTDENQIREGGANSSPFQTDMRKGEFGTFEPGGVKARAEAMISHLLQLAQTVEAPTANKRSDARSKVELAELRHAYLNPVRAMKYVVPFLEETPRQSDETFFMVASLFALHPRGGGSKSIGEAMRSVNGNGSTEGRFFALLSTPGENLADNLRSVVTLLAAKNVNLNWYQLLDDVLHWDDENRPVQLRLAREFYRPTTELDDDVAEILAEAE